MMETKGLKFELPVTSVQRATKFRPFQKKLCTPIHFGVTLMTGAHMRGFWFATVSLFVAFLGWFSIAPLLIRIREYIGICDNQEDLENGSSTECICTESCKRMIGTFKIASLISTTVMRLLFGGLLEKFGPKNVQCALLFSGAIFVASASLIKDATGLIIVGVLIGTVGASFVTIQFWMALLFSPEILGIVNGTVAGWGNLGCGVAIVLVPVLEQVTRNWRTVLLVPGTFMLLCSILMFFFSQDTPMGPILVERDLKKKKTSPRDYLGCISDYRVFILAIQYGACFGAEVIMNWELVTHFHDYFGMSLIHAGWLSSGFGAMNIFARSLGGSFSDLMYQKIGLRGRLFVQFVSLLCEAVCLLIFGYMSRESAWMNAFIVLVLFSFFTQTAEASTFSIVPHVQQKNLGIVSAVTAAGGTLFAVASEAAFYKNIPDFLMPFRLHACFVLFSAFLTFFIKFELHGSLLVKPILSRYCAGDFFSYVLEWELQFDSTYHVVGSYISPLYQGILFNESKRENYVNAAKKRNIGYGEGIVGGVGRTRKHCIVEMISEEAKNIKHIDMIEGVSKDHVQTVLYFASQNGRRVIEVGGCNRYQLVEGESLNTIEKILAGNGSTKKLKRCLRKVNFA